MTNLTLIKRAPFGSKTVDYYGDGLPYKNIAREARERVYLLASIPGLKGA